MKTKQHGFSLVEIMIALGILMAAILGFMQFNKKQTESMTTVKNSSEMFIARNTIANVLMNTQNCEASLSGRIVQSNKVNDEMADVILTKVRSDGTTTQVNQFDGEDGTGVGGGKFELINPFLRFTAYKFEVPDLTGNPPQVDMDLLLVFNRKTGQGEWREKTERITLTANLDYTDPANPTITSCTAQSGINTENISNEILAQACAMFDMDPYYIVDEGRIVCK